jgi:hypothetical protein
MTWQELIKAFEKERLRNVELIRIAKRIEAGTLTFEQASLYARILGDVLGRLYGETDIFPDGISEHEALTVLKPSLTRAYSLASVPAMAAQEIQNQKYGVPLKAWRPTIKPGRIEGLAGELATQGYKQENFTPQVVNVTQSAVDDTMSVNSYNLAKEGYETTYIRKTHGDKICSYCAALAGQHTSKDAPAGYFGHHRNCTCTVEVVGIAKKGKWYAKGFADNANAGKIEGRVGTDSIDNRTVLNVGFNNDKYFIDEPKISRFLLLPGAKHSKEFFDVGYTIHDGELLNNDIYKQFDLTNVDESWTDENGHRRISMYMLLGKSSKKKRFITVWVFDRKDGLPRFITAFRRNS